MKVRETHKDLFLWPRSVIFVGPPRESGPGFLNPLDNLTSWGFRGKIHLVHPHVREIAGFPTVKDLSMIEEPVDLTVVSTPRETVPGIIAQCGEKGIRAIVVTNQGFADADSIGQELQRAIGEEARRVGARILGPNTLGVVNAFHGFTSSFMPLKKRETPIGVICQSGIFIVDARHLIGGMGMGVDIGNGCDLGLADALEWLGSEEAIRVIAVHAEGIPEGRRFLEVAARVARLKPIVVLKSGRSQAGARAAVSHTGSLCGEDGVADAALRRAGQLLFQFLPLELDLLIPTWPSSPRTGPSLVVALGRRRTRTPPFPYRASFARQPTSLSRPLSVLSSPSAT